MMEERIKLYSQLYDFLNSRFLAMVNNESFENTVLVYWHQYEDYILKFKHTLINEPIIIDEFNNIIGQAKKVKERLQSVEDGYETSVKELKKMHLLAIRDKRKVPVLIEINTKEKNRFLRYKVAVAGLIQKVVELKHHLQKIKTVNSNNPDDPKGYSLRQVCIAYHFMGGINEENAAKLLKTHTRYESVAKLLAKRVKKPSDLTQLSENKTADKKKLKDLQAAKRLMSGKKNKEALKHITHAITQFQTAFKNHY